MIFSYFWVLVEQQLFIKLKMQLFHFNTEYMQKTTNVGLIIGGLMEVLCKAQKD